MQHYAGELRLLGEGVSTTTKTGAAYLQWSTIEVGDHEIRKVAATDYMASQMHIGDDIEVWIQKLAFAKYVTAVRRGGVLRKGGAKPFVSEAVISFLPAIPLVALAAVSGSTIMWLIVLGYVGWRAWSLFGKVSAYKQIA